MGGDICPTQFSASHLLIRQFSWPLQPMRIGVASSGRSGGIFIAMAADQGHRKLTAILAADVAGYSRLMADDDRATILTLTEYRDVFANHIQTHEGHVVDTAGDSVLATFDSVVEAVEAAVEIQRDLGGRNEALPDHRRMHFRIGVNLGDIIIRGDGTAYGDGVNVAARLEGLAVAGGIMISQTAYDHVDGRLDVGLADAGAHEVKNFAKPVRAWRVLLDGAESVKGAASQPPAKSLRRRKIVAGLIAGLAALIGLTVWGVSIRVDAPQMVKADGTPTDDTVLAMPTGPAIAVLPFENISGDPSQDYFATGLTENLIINLSLFDMFLVIARNSTVKYAGLSMDVREIGRELGARYVIEGSVSRTDDTVRVSVKLLDALDGTNLWAETFDRDATASNLFTIQDEISARVAATIGDAWGVVARTTIAASQTKAPEHLTTVECSLRVVAYYDAISPDKHLEIRDCARRATTLEPSSTLAWVTLAWITMDEHRFGLNSEPDSLSRAEQMFRKAIALDPTDQASRHGLAELYLAQGDVDSFVAEGRRAIELNPNNANVLAGIGNWMLMAGIFDPGLDYVEKSISLNPGHPSWLYFGITLYQYSEKDYEGALESTRRIEWREFPRTQMYFAAIYGQLDRLEEAQAAVEQLLELDPNYIENHWDELRKDSVPEEVIEAFAEGLRKAGLAVPSKPPLTH
jgi:adenylate cyclase